MTVWSGITSSINSLENCVILYRQCQLNKVDRMPTSTTYFRQIVVFHLDHERVFVETSVKLEYFVTILSLVTLKGSLRKQAR